MVAESILRSFPKIVCTDFSACMLQIVCFSFFVWAEIPSCHYQGFVCSSTCQTLYYCIGANAKAAQLMVCDGEDLCNSINGTCSNDEGLSCFAEHTFECKSAGYFPDPYNCSAYYNCTGSAPPFANQTMKCDQLAYDVTAKACDLPTTSSVCNRNGRIPQCNKAGDSGVVEGDNSLYYTCIRDSVYLYLYPELRKCSGDGTYDPNTSTCS